MSGHPSGVYYPEDLSLLGNALDKAFASLPEEQRTPCNRIEIAKALLASAAAGESDPAKLGQAALINLKPTDRRRDSRADRNVVATSFRYRAQPR